MGDYVTPFEAGLILGCSTDNVRLLARTGRLVVAIHTRAGRLFLRTDVEQLAKNRRRSNGEAGSVDRGRR